jgi:hypothetical protein
MEGHLDWVRCLDWSSSAETASGDSPAAGEIFLASGSQDAYVRLWSLTPLATAAAAGLDLESAAVEDADEAGVGLDEKLFEEFEKRLNGGAAGGDDDEGGVGQVSLKSFVVTARNFDGRCVNRLPSSAELHCTHSPDSLPAAALRQFDKVLARILGAAPRARHLGHLAPLFAAVADDAAPAALGLGRQLADPLGAASVVVGRGSDLVPAESIWPGVGQGPRLLRCSLGWRRRRTRGPRQRLGRRLERLARGGRPGRARWLEGAHGSDRPL